MLTSLSCSCSFKNFFFWAMLRWQSATLLHECRLKSSKKSWTPPIPHYSAPMKPIFLICEKVHSRKERFRCSGLAERRLVWARTLQWSPVPVAYWVDPHVGAEPCSMLCLSLENISVGYSACLSPQEEHTWFLKRLSSGATVKFSMPIQIRPLHGSENFDRWTSAGMYSERGDASGPYDCINRSRLGSPMLVG